MFLISFKYHISSKILLSFGKSETKFIINFLGKPKKQSELFIKTVFYSLSFLTNSLLDFPSLKSQTVMQRAEAAGNEKVLGVIKHLACWKYTLNPCFPENNVFVITLNLLHHIFNSEPCFSLYLISVLISRIIENPRLNELLTCKTSCSHALYLSNLGTKHSFLLYSSSLKDKPLTLLQAHMQMLGLGQHAVD